MANKMLEMAKDAVAANRGGDDAAIRAIELEANRLFGEGASDEKFAWRNEQRAAQGLPIEERERGGLAGAYDRGDLTKIALGLAGTALVPLAAGALGGGAAAAGAGSGAGAGAAGATLPPVAAAGGGLLGKVGGFLGSPAMDTITKLGTAAYGIGQQNKANDLTNNAIAADRARWEAGAPLREAGMQGLLAPVPADTSALTALAGQGNPFARPLAPRPSPPPTLPPIPATSPAPAPQGAGLPPLPVRGTGMARRVR